MAPDLSIVIVSMNTRDWLHQCLTSLAANSDVTREVIVVDNVSHDGSADMVEKEFPEVKLTRNQEQYGFSQNNNIGAKVSTAPVLLFLNPDTKVPKGSLRRMLEVVASRLECGVFGGRLLDDWETVELSTGAFPTVPSIVIDKLLSSATPMRPLLNGFSQRHYLGYDTMHLVDWITGAYFWIRRELLESIGGWDSNFFMYCEDADLCYRARKAGYRTLYVPQSTIYHFHNKTPMSLQRRRELNKEGFRIFAQKHYGPITRWLAKFY